MSVLMNYYRNIDREKVQFDFLYFIEPGEGYSTYKSEIEALGGHVYLIPNFKNFVTFNKMLSILLSENNEYNTVHIHDPFVLRFVYKTLRKSGIKNIVVHSHATQWSDKKISGMRNRILCHNLKYLIDYPFACSYAAGEFLYGRGSKFDVINNAIDVQRYKYSDQIRKEIRYKLQIDKNVVFGHVGNFNNQKNHNFLIDVFEKIVELNDQALLLLIGDGSLKPDIEMKVAMLGLQNKVKFLGKKKDVENYYQAMDCLILPSLYEGLPMVGVESQCSGLPVLFSDEITREVGLVNYKYLSLNQTPGEWAEEAVRLADRTYCRNNAAQIIEKKGFNIAKEAEKLVGMYEKMIG